MTRPVILTVDDDPQVLAAIASDLRKHYAKDYRIVRATSAAEALDALRTLKDADEPVALLLSDQRMPGLDGVGFLAQAKELFPAAKRALLTAYADTDAAIAAINESQVDYYLQKPWDPPEQQLYPIIDDLLEDWRAQYRPGYGGVKVIGSRYMPTVHQIKDFLARNHVPYEFFDVELTDERGAEARRLAEGVTLPLVILPGGERMEAPGLQRHRAEGGVERRSQRRHLRRRDCRRRPRRAGGRGVRVLGRAQDDPDRSRGPWRTGRILEPDRKLPGLPGRCIGLGPGAACADAGEKVRCRSRRAAQRGQRAARSAVQVPHGARRRRHGARDRVQGAGAHHGPGLAATASRLHRAVRRARRLLRVGEHRSVELPGPGGLRRGRRKLRRSGRDLPGAVRAARGAGRPRKAHRREDVAVPGEPHRRRHRRDRQEDRSAVSDGSHRVSRPGTPRRADACATARPARRPTWTPASSSSSSARRRAPDGWGISCASTLAGSC